MRRFFAFFTLLLPLSACDTVSTVDQAPTFRGGEKCDWCMQQQSDILEKQKQEFTESDCSLGTMLACLNQGLLTEAECSDLVLMQGGQLDVYMKWLQVNEEAEMACLDVCQ